MIPSFFQMTRRKPPDKLPYGAHDTWGAVLRYHLQATGARIPGFRVRGAYHAAVDVWDVSARQHLWRSWSPEQGESAEDWTTRVHGQALHDHDTGPWAVPGIEHVADWPVPTSRAAAGGPARPLAMLHAGLVSLCAAATCPSGPVDYMQAVEVGTLLSEAALYNMRSALRTASWVVQADRLLAFRVAVFEALPGAASVSAGVRWWVQLRDRDTGAERLASFEAPPQAQTRVLSAEARRVLGLTGWPSQRLPGTMTWRLRGARYEFEIRRG